jgi:hypothetical protein
LKVYDFLYGTGVSAKKKARTARKQGGILLGINQVENVVTVSYCR